MEIIYLTIGIIVNVFIPKKDQIDELGSILNNSGVEILPFVCV